MGDQLYINFYKQLKNNVFEVPLESVLTFFISKYLEDVHLQIFLVQDQNTSNLQTFVIDVCKFDYEILDKSSFLSRKLLCEMPCIFTDNNTVISGLCAVNRQIIKNSDQAGLLGFKNACLKAPNETSIWTKFCEIDMMSTTNTVHSHEFGNVIIIPENIIRLENHMCQPIRIHNIYKIAQKQNKHVTCLTRKEDLNISHNYVEGPFMTIADLILWPQLHLILDNIYADNLTTEIPLTIKWYQDLFETPQIKNAVSVIVSKCTKLKNVVYEKPVLKPESLYKSDPKRYKPQNRIYTKQEDIDKSFSIVSQLPFEINAPNRPFGFEIEFDWTNVPLEANPDGGALPSCRAFRKRHQLENLAKSVMKIAKPHDVIVDFCSGSGHLGILLAVKLPKCTIILLENKEESLTRAKKRIEKLQLDNVKLLQCNLDYFNGDFNIGVSLHACGVATDLVIQQCLCKNASFVCCPCCYGGVHDCHHLTYPRSKLFKESGLTLKDYLVLGHSADQTHGDKHAKTKQGYYCMDVIDTDRMFQAKEFNYHVVLGKLEPSCCTPKNNLLVGWPENLKSS